MSDNRVSSDIEVWFLLPLRIFGKGFPLMISRRFVVCISSLLLTFTLGCQHSQCVSSNSCRSGGCLPIGGSCMSGWMKQKMGSCNARKRCHRSECGGGDYGCNSCGMTSGGDMNYGGDMMNPDNIYGAASFGGSPGGCGCGQPSGGGYSGTPPGMMSPMESMPNKPTPDSNFAPQPIPQQSSPTAPSPDGSASIPHGQSGQPQMVSIEEFHRLPGTTVSGVGSAPPVPSMVNSATSEQPLMVVPQLSSAPAQVQSSGKSHQVNWVPVK